MKTSLMLLSLLVAMPSFAAIDIPSFKAIGFSMSHATEKSSHRWAVSIAAPEKHHFNLQAPMSAVITPKSSGIEVKFSVDQKTENKILFGIMNASITPSDNATVIAYLCDDAKTYCVKKQELVPLSSVSPSAVDLGVLPSQNKKKSKEAVKSVDSGAPHKDEHGFWINAQKEAVAEALATGRPLLIDFYGIWCPPCNLFNEFVFPKTEFQKAAANYVLLKLDADQEASWELKSKFKIAGYPTLLFARLNSVNGKTELQEINRVAGFHDLASLSQEMNATYARRLENPNGVLAGGPGSPDYIPALKKQIDFEIDQHEYAAVLDHATAGIAAAPNDAGFKLFRQVALMGLNHDVYKKDKTKLSAFLTAGETPAILYRIQKQKKISNPTTLLRGAELINQALDLLDDPKFSDLQHLKTQAMDYLNELYTRINPKTMFIDGVEMSQGDLDEMRGDLAEATHDEVLLKKTYEDGVKTYEKMIAIYHEKDSRGLNLEYAYFLRKSGRIKQAKALYSRFIKKYPQEFTFYYPFAKLYVETKELNMAFIMAENAVAYAYGDNKIRCVELLAKVMAAQGENAKAIETITQFLASFKAPPIELRLRTQRYLDSLAELKEKLKAGKPS